MPGADLYHAAINGGNYEQERCKVIIDDVVKSPSVAFLLPGKRKVRFSLSLQINNLQSKLLICAPVHGRDDDFLRSHH